MFNTITTNRFVWDAYAQIAAAGIFQDATIPTKLAAERVAAFADEMCRQRATRFPPEVNRGTKKNI